MQVAFSAGEISELVGSTQTRGNTSESIRGIAGLMEAAAGDLSFLSNSKYRAEVGQSKASLILIPADYAGEPQQNQVFLVVDNPSLALGRLCTRIEQSLWPRPAPGIHPSAVVSKTAKVASSATVGPLCVVEDQASVGEGAHLQAQVFVGRGAQVGSGTWLMPGVIVAAECVVKNRVLLQPGVVIGGDGFGYEFFKGHHEKVPQIGNVVIEDDVEIGANTTIDRARFSSTTIGQGTKIDNLVQVGHNSVIGKHCMICGQVGIAGSCVIEDYVVIGGQTGLEGHITIGAGSKIGAQSGVKGDLPPKSAVWGTPSNPLMLEMKLIVLRRRLPELFQRVLALEELVRKE